MTWRAILLGLCGAWVLAYLTPWNDWAARNTLVHGSYLPPVLLVALVVFSGFLNRHLGRWRFRPSEIATVLALLLVVGSVASIGLMRHFPAVLVDPARAIQNQATRGYWNHDGGAEQIQAQMAERLALAQRAIARHDRDGDGQLTGAERLGLGFVLTTLVDAASPMTAEALVAGLLPPPDGLIPTVPAALQAADLTADPNSLAHERIVGRFQRGDPGGGLVAAGAVFVLEGPDGQRLRLRYTDGHDALVALANGEGVADPSGDPRAARLLTLPIGGVIDVDGQEFHLRAVASGIPWQPWLSALLAWSPVILAMIAGALALAAIVRHQWVHHERLTMPIAHVLGSLTGADGTDEGGRPAIFAAKSLWIAAGVVVGIHAIRLLHTLGYSPITIPLDLDLSALTGVVSALDRSPERMWLLSPRVTMTMIAIAFLMTTEVSGSMWGSFVVVNLLAGFAIASGVPMSGGDLDHGAVGAAGVLCLVVLWTGRHHYGAAVAAALGRQRSPEATAAAPWIWVLFGVCVLLTAFLVVAGAPLIGSIAVTIITFGTMLALARVVAETGTPYASFGGNGRVSGIILGILGPSCGAAALMPLLMVGYVVGNGDRERLLPHALHAAVVQERAGKPGGSRLFIILGVTCLGAAVLAFIAMLGVTYSRGQMNVDAFGTNTWGWSLTQATALLHAPEAAAGKAQHTWIAYAVGGAVFGLLSLARWRWAGFPIHPIGLIVIGGWVTKMNWAAFAVGWLLKVLVMRYGGQALYRRLFPVAVGCIIGEAIMVVVCMAIGLLRVYLGLDRIDLTILPS